MLQHRCPQERGGGEAIIRVQGRRKRLGKGGSIKLMIAVSTYCRSMHMHTIQACRLGRFGGFRRTTLLLGLVASLLLGLSIDHIMVSTCGIAKLGRSAEAFAIRACSILHSCTCTHVLKHACVYIYNNHNYHDFNKYGLSWAKGTI